MPQSPWPDLVSPSPHAPQQQAHRAGLAAWGWAAASTSGRIPAGSANAAIRAAAPLRRPSPGHHLDAAQPSACAVRRNATSAWNARCAVCPCRSSTRAAGSLPVRKRCQVRSVHAAGMVADRQWRRHAAAGPPRRHRPRPRRRHGGGLGDRCRRRLVAGRAGDGSGWRNSPRRRDRRRSDGCGAVGSMARDRAAPR